ncbi:cobalamin-dependent protein [bacterium]|nr:cobalamin-dependent protein [bacterium]
MTVRPDSRCGPENRFNRVLLISPPSSSYLGAARPPQNLGYLAESLRRSGIAHRILDMRLDRGYGKIKKMISRFEPDLVGISLVSMGYKRSYDLIKTVKRLDPRIRIVAGGPHVTVLQEKVLEDCPDLDYAVIHEGEQTLVNLCRSRDTAGRIPGLLTREKDRIVSGGSPPVQENLDDVPFPTYAGFEMSRYIQEIPLNSSRGCPFQCVFCPNKLITKRYRYRSAGNVVDEIEFWFRRGYRIFNFDDDNFSLIPERVYAICDELDARRIRDAEFRCSNGLRADRVTRDLLARMKSVGFHYIAFGVDGGNDKMLALNRKGESLASIEKALQDACDLSFDVKIFCILTMPGETIEDTEDAFRLVQKYPVKRVILNNPIPYPGTELFETVSRNGWFAVDPEIYLNENSEDTRNPVFITPELGYSERVRLLKKARRIERRVTRRAVAGMFPGPKGLGFLLGAVAASGFFERIYFKNLRFRRMAESMRHRRMINNQRRDVS